MVGHSNEDDRAEVWLIAGFIVALTVVMVGLVVALPGPDGPDEPEVVRVRTESVGPPGVRVTVPPLVPGRGELVARFAPPSTTTTVPPATTVDEAASSMAIEATPEGPVVVNPPEAPVAEGPLAELVCSYDWPCQQALAIARCESTMRPHVISPTNDYGLMQINGVHRGRWRAMGYSEADMLRPGPNLAVAHAIWAEQGWGPWSCAR
ncbi:MAG: transglycosylase SLT domain-containing protein [Acidimicrobiia bacterium]|nr:transglycosylase SLT domain-containing protein [Acidimicrobiia bacterium]